MLINEYRLTPVEPKSRKFLEGEMEKFFFGPGSAVPGNSWTPAAPDRLGELTLRRPARSNRGRSRVAGQVAQLVEQRTENPRVGGSIPPLATNWSA